MLGIIYRLECAAKYLGTCHSQTRATDSGLQGEPAVHFLNGPATINPHPRILKLPEKRQLRQQNAVTSDEVVSLNSSSAAIDIAPSSTTTLQALLVVSPDGKIQFATARADRWMRDLATVGHSLDCLPPVLARWLCAGSVEIPSSKLIPDKAGGRLRIQVLFRERNSICLLLMREPEVSPNIMPSALTERQTQVLSWVARGKTNAEIGKILNLKTKTIGKYLERIFPKLGVENRTSAAGWVLDRTGAS